MSALKRPEIMYFICPDLYFSSQNYHRLNVRTGHYTPIPVGCSPLKRTLQEYIRYGVINLDKPAVFCSLLVAALSDFSPDLFRILLLMKL